MCGLLRDGLCWFPYEMITLKPHREAISARTYKTWSHEYLCVEMYVLSYISESIHTQIAYNVPSPNNMDAKQTIVPCGV